MKSQLSQEKLLSVDLEAYPLIRGGINTGNLHTLLSTAGKCRLGVVLLEDSVSSAVKAFSSGRTGGKSSLSVAIDTVTKPLESLANSSEECKGAFEKVLKGKHYKPHWSKGRY